MPKKPLPKKLVSRLRKASHKIDSVLWKMKNIDSLSKEPEMKKFLKQNPKETRLPGTRVRQMNVSRNFPGTELIIKRTDWRDAKGIVRKVKEMVKEHNRKFKKEKYQIVMPKGYALNDELIAMSKIDAPTLDEVISYSSRERTKRGKFFFRALQKQQAEKGIKITEGQLRKIADRACGNSGWYESNFYLLGFRNGKFILMPSPAEIT